MKSPFESRLFAEECRVLANGLSPERRQEVLRMADIWEALARDRQDVAKRKARSKYRQARQTAKAPLGRPAIRPSGLGH
jgi:hypothetical protein